MVTATNLAFAVKRVDYFKFGSIPNGAGPMVEWGVFFSFAIGRSLVGIWMGISGLTIFPRVSSFYRRCTCGSCARCSTHH